MVFSPPPDYLYQTIHPITGVVTTWTQMVGSDLSFARASASYSVFSADGGINPFGKGPAPLKIRTFKFDFIHVYQLGETYTSVRDQLMTALGHGRETVFFVKCGDGSLRMGRGNVNVSNMPETRDAIVMFKATIEFECVNPYLTDQFETGTLLWDSTITWDVGHAVYQLAASATLTGGTYTLSYGGNTTIPLHSYDPAEWINGALASATPAPIPFIATGSPPGSGPFAANPPQPLILSAKTPGTRTAFTVTPSGITGGTLALSTIQVGSAVGGNTWDFSPNSFPLTSGAVSWTINARGNASDRECILFANGPMNTYYVYNLSLPGGLSGYLGFVMLEPLNAGETHVIDVGRQSVRKIVGGNIVSAWPSFYLPPGQEDWFRIDPGVNFISVQQSPPAQTTGSFRISTKGHYL